MIRTLGTAAVLVAAALVPGTASGAEAAACLMRAGAVTATGDHRGVSISSTSPPRATTGYFSQGFFKPGQVRLSASTTVQDDGFGGTLVYGYMLSGDGLYATRYVNANMVVNGTVTRIGGGWTNFTALEESDYQGPGQTAVSRRNTYGLRSDGTLFRWTIGRRAVWQNQASAPGFAAVKSMALISKSATYDTFLANTRGGALYTIHIPTSAPMKPIVKQVRSRTWQNFEVLVAEKCGQLGTVLLGIDRETKSGYLYAVGHANGTATVIQSLGKVPVTFGDPVYFRWKSPGAPLNGE